MSYISKFKQDVPYSNVDINEALSIITTQGVAPNTPNGILSSISEEGVTHQNQSCRVVFNNEEKTQIKILSGTVIMPDGSYIIIADEVLELPSSSIHYVYIYKDLILHNIPVCRDNLPADPETYVLLATVENEVITDQRSVAVSKIDGFGLNTVANIDYSFTIHSGSIPANSYFASLTVDPGYTRVMIYNTEYHFFGVFNMTSGMFEYSFYPEANTVRLNQKYVYTRSILRNLFMDYHDGKVHFASSSDISSVTNTTFNFKITIF